MMLIYILLGCTPQSTEQVIEVCSWESFPTESYALLPNAPKTQIHSDIAFDGEKIWMVYNYPNEQKKFKVN